MFPLRNSGIFLIFIFTTSWNMNESEGAYVNLKIYEYEWLKKVITDPLNNVNVRPTIMNTTEPIEISVSMLIRNFEAIDDRKMEYSMQVEFRQEWEDDRLAYSKYNPVQLRQIKYLTLLETDKVWRPDTYFRNEKSSSVHNLMRPNNFIRIYANGTVFYNTRLTLTLSCPMNLNYFPFDVHTCKMQLGSYSFGREDLIFKWKPIPKPIALGPDFYTPTEFIYKSATSNYCDAQTTTAGVFSCLLAEFHFHRSHGYYLRQNFIPVANLVIIAWFSFLLDIEKDKTFLLRGIICLMASSMAFYKVSSFSPQIPKTNSPTAMDFYTGISLTFIFVAFVEFIVVYYLSTHEFHKMGDKSGSGFSTKLSSKRNSGLEDIEMARTTKEENVSNEPENFEVERKKSVEVQTHWTTKLVPEKIEKWTRILYPAFYLGFNLIFWLVCSNSGDLDH